MSSKKKLLEKLYEQMSNKTEEMRGLPNDIAYQEGFCDWLGWAIWVLENDIEWAELKSTL